MIRRLFLVFCLAYSTVASAINPVADWHFDELSWNGAVDEIRDSQGSYHGTSRDVSPTEGKICNAIDLRKNSNTDYAILGEGALDGANDFTISVWHKGDAGDDSNSLLSGARTGKDNALLWWYTGDTRFIPHLDNQKRTLNGININDSNWHHLVWRREGQESCYFADGVKQNCSTVNAAIPLSISSLILGQDQDSVGGRFDKNQDWEGILDELIVFKESLSDDEIMDIYDNQNAGKNWDGSTRVCNMIDIELPVNSCLYQPQINFTTYNTSGYTYDGSYYPRDDLEFQQWISDRATDAYKYGSTYIDNISTSGTSNNDPNHSGTDDYYIGIMEGYIYLPTAGVYRFGIDGDDAVEVYIDDELITGWWNGHGKAGSAQFIVQVNASAGGYHKVEFHMQEKAGGDNFYLYWDRGDGGAMEIVPTSNYFHCIMKPIISITKTSCVISDPVNNTTSPKRIPGAVIRYAIEVNNTGAGDAEDVNVTDDLDTVHFDTSTIDKIQIKDGACDCKGTTSAGVANTANPVVLEFDTVAAPTGGAAVVQKCGYFEVEIK